jgi:hypothetical protein
VRKTGKKELAGPASRRHRAGLSVPQKQPDKKNVRLAKAGRLPKAAEKEWEKDPVNGRTAWPAKKHIAKTMTMNGRAAGGTSISPSRIRLHMRILPASGIPDAEGPGFRRRRLNHTVIDERSP